MHPDVSVLLHLVEGPVNLGAVCRAMANTGFETLRFSGPLDASFEDARKFALHAQPLLDRARHCASLEDLTAGCDSVFGFTPRNPWDDGRGLTLDGFHEQFAQARASGKRIGLLFGNEARGLENAHLLHCTWRVALPTHEGYPSMNLSQAVMVVLWELSRAAAPAAAPTAMPLPDLADAADKQQLLANLRTFLEALELLNPQNPEHIWSEIAPLFATRDWTRRELTLLHAVFGKGRARYLALQRKIPPSGASSP